LKSSHLKLFATPPCEIRRFNNSLIVWALFLVRMPETAIFELLIAILTALVHSATLTSYFPAHSTLVFCLNITQGGVVQ